MTLEIRGDNVEPRFDGVDGGKVFDPNTVDSAAFSWIEALCDVFTLITCVLLFRVALSTHYYTATVNSSHDLIISTVREFPSLFWHALLTVMVAVSFVGEMQMAGWKVSSLWMLTGKNGPLLGLVFTVFAAAIIFISFPQMEEEKVESVKGWVHSSEGLTFEKYDFESVLDGSQVRLSDDQGRLVEGRFIVDGDGRLLFERNENSREGVAR